MFGDQIICKITAGDGGDATISLIRRIVDGSGKYFILDVCNGSSVVTPIGVIGQVMNFGYSFQIKSISWQTILKISPGSNETRKEECEKFFKSLTAVLIERNG